MTISLFPADSLGREVYNTMENKEKNYAVINCIFNLDIDSNSLSVKLNEVDIRKIFRVLNNLTNDLSVEFDDREMETLTYVIFIDNNIRIKIVNDQLYVFRNDVLEFLVDQNYLVRNIILKKAIRNNYDDMRKIMRLIYPVPGAKRKNQMPKSSKRKNSSLW